VWFDALVTNVDRTPRNTNMLVWHQNLWLIDHGAALYFHHSWDDYMERSQSRFPQIKEHVLLPCADALLEVDTGLSARLTAEVITEIVQLIPMSGCAMSSSSRARSSIARPMSIIFCSASKRREPLWRKRNMPDNCTFDYAIIRIVPRVERQEFLNAGVIVFCSEQGFLDARGRNRPAAAGCMGAVGRSAHLLMNICAQFLWFAVVVRRPGRSASCRSARAFTGWSRRAAPSSRLRPCIPACASTRKMRWKT
jgi:hypothetical protein